MSYFPGESMNQYNAWKENNPQGASTSIWDYIQGGSPKPGGQVSFLASQGGLTEGQQQSATYNLNKIYEDDRRSRGEQGPTSINPNDPETARKRQEAAALESKSRGRAATYLFSDKSQPNIFKRALLGG